MRTKNTIIIIAVIIIIAIIGIVGYSYLSNTTTTKYKNITICSINLEVPDSNTTITNKTNLYQIYNDTTNNITIFTFDSEGSNFGDASEMIEFAANREASQIGASSVTKDNVTFNKSNTTNTCSYVGNYTHKNILIITHDEDQMILILNKMHLTNTTNNTNTTVQTTSHTTKKK